MKKIILSTILASSLVIAADVNKDDQLVTHTELGYVETQGNTQTKTFNLDAKAKKGWGKHIFNAKLDAQYASDNDVETKNKYLVELQYDYEFTERFSFNYLAGYKDDKFSGFEYQFYTGPGAKYKVIVSEKHNLSLEANILYSIDRYEAVPTAVPPQAAYDDDYTSYRAKAVYGWQMLENLKFDQELSIRGSVEDSDVYYTYSKSALTSKLSDIFSAGVSYKVDYANRPATGKEKTDTTITANLIIDY